MIRNTVVLAIAGGHGASSTTEHRRALRRASARRRFPGNGTPAAEAIASRQLVRIFDISEAGIKP